MTRFGVPDNPQVDETNEGLTYAVGQRHAVTPTADAASVTVALDTPYEVVRLSFAKTEAGALSDQNQPITVSIRRDGTIFLGEDELPYGALSDRATALASGDLARPVYVRADGAAQYGIVAQVMAGLSASGFTRINLITDTGGPAPAPGPAETPQG